MEVVEHAATHGKGLAALATTAAAGAVSWLDVANQYVDLISGILAIAAGAITVAWYIYQFAKQRRGGESNDKTDSGK